MPKNLLKFSYDIIEIDQNMVFISLVKRVSYHELLQNIPIMMDICDLKHKVKPNLFNHIHNFPM